MPGYINLFLRSSAWVFLGNSSQQIIGFAVFAYLAIVLSPSDFGLIALSTAMVDIVTVFGRFGVIELLLRSDSNKERENSAFWAVLLFGLTSVALLAGVGYFLSIVYSDSRLFLNVVLLSIVPLFSNIGLVHEALARREFDYKKIAFRNTAAAILSGAAALLAVNSDFGYYSLIIQKNVFVLSSSILLFLAIRWLPSRIKFSNLRFIYSSGTDISFPSVVAALFPRAIDFTVGYFFGLVVLGYLRFAWRIFDFITQVIIQPVANVMVSAFHKCNGSLGCIVDKYSLITYRLAEVVTILCSSVWATIPLLINWIFGNEWRMASPILQLLILASPILPSLLIFPQFLYSLKKQRVARNLSLLQISIGVFGLIVCSLLGYTWVLMFLVLRFYIVYFIQLLWLNNSGLLPVRPIIISLFRNCLLFGFGALSGIFFVSVIEASIPAIISAFSLSLILVVIFAWISYKLFHDDCSVFNLFYNRK